MKPTASARDLSVGAVMLIAAAVYLVGFVPLGWVPHDEGMLGQSADRVLHGDIPHVDYDEPYTGALSWLYAGVFKVAGVDLLNLRWFLFAGAVATIWLTYAIARRFLGPIGAGLATWVALGWSFPNYFAALPSWWLLLCALLCSWAVIRHTETHALAWLFVAGAAAGTAVAIKQTGLYLLAALLLTLLYGNSPSAVLASKVSRRDRAIQLGAAMVALVLVMLILWQSLFQAEGVYLFLPIAACAALLLARTTPSSPSAFPRGQIAAIAVVLLAAALAPALLLIPYVTGTRLWDLANGLVVLPRKRLAFASAAMPSTWWILTGIPLAALVFVERCRQWTPSSRIARTVLWGAAILLPTLAIRYRISYQAVWQSTRAFAALAPIGICWRLRSGDVEPAGRRVVLFMLATTLAWMSLNQFPFAAAIYFSYVAPLAVLLAVASAAVTPPVNRETMTAWGLMLVLFAVLVTNQGDLYTLGIAYGVRPPSERLDLPRAHLNISEGDVGIYRQLVFAIEAQLHGGHLVAGPDCPEVYFLVGLFSPSGELFDFFSRGEPTQELAAWSQSNVIVVNHHPEFSPPPSRRLLASLRHEFQFGREIGKFEIRWR